MDYYYSEDGTSWSLFNSGEVSKGGSARSIYVGRYFCSLDLANDTVRTDGPDYGVRTDFESTCTDNYLKSGSPKPYFSTTPAPSSWVCGTHSIWGPIPACSCASPIPANSYCTGNSYICSTYPPLGNAPCNYCPPPTTTTTS